MQFTTNPPETPHNHTTPPQNPPPDEPGEQSLKETGPTKEGAPNPGRTAPEPDSMPRPRARREEGETAAPGGSPAARPATPSVFAAEHIRNPLERR